MLWGLCGGIFHYDSPLGRTPHNKQHSTSAEGVFAGGFPPPLLKLFLKSFWLYFWLLLKNWVLQQIAQLTKEKKIVASKQTIMMTLKHNMECLIDFVPEDWCKEWVTKCAAEHVISMHAPFLVQYCFKSIASPLPSVITCYQRGKHTRAIWILDCLQEKKFLPIQRWSGWVVAGKCTIAFPQPLRGALEIEIIISTCGAWIPGHKISAFVVLLVNKLYI